MVRYTSPVNPSVYPHLAILLLGIGLFFMAWFFVYPLLTCASHVWGGILSALEPILFFLEF